MRNESINGAHARTGAGPIELYGPTVTRRYQPAENAEPETLLEPFTPATTTAVDMREPFMIRYVEGGDRSAQPRDSAVEAHVGEETTRREPADSHEETGPAHEDSVYAGHGTDTPYDEPADSPGEEAGTPQEEPIHSPPEIGSMYDRPTVGAGEDPGMPHDPSIHFRDVDRLPYDEPSYADEDSFTPPDEWPERPTPEGVAEDESLASDGGGNGGDMDTRQGALEAAASPPPSVEPTEAPPVSSGVAGTESDAPTVEEADYPWVEELRHAAREPVFGAPPRESEQPDAAATLESPATGGVAPPPADEPIPHEAVEEVAARLEQLAARLRDVGLNAVAGTLRNGDRFDALLAGLVAGFLAASPDAAEEDR